MHLSKTSFLMCLICFLWSFPLASFAQTPGDGDDGEEIIEEPPEDVPPPPAADNPAGGEAENAPPAEPYGQTLDGPGPIASPEKKSRGFWPRWRKPPRTYNPDFGFLGQFFVATHPTDTYFGVNLSAQFHLSAQFSASFDIRAGGGIDRDGDHYAHPMGSIGGSLAYWWHGWDRIRRWRPYLRIGAGWMGLGEETFDDGSDDDDDDDDWDKSRRFKKNGIPAPGHSNLYMESVAGLRWVLFPRLWYLAVGGSFDLELGMVHDFHYGISDAGFKFAFGLTIFF